MNKTMLICALLSAAAASLPAQQGADPYSGTSNPPPDDQITISAPAKPHPGKPAAPPAQPPAAARETPAPSADAVRPTVAGETPAGSDATPPPAATDAAVGNAVGGGDPDGDIVHPGRQTAAREAPQLVERAAGAADSAAPAAGGDPDGDIVHPRALRAGELAEGTSIRVRLLERLSTATTEKGEAFSSRVASDVVRDGVVLIPAGAEISGHVAQASSGHLGRRGMMRLHPEMIRLPDGRRFELRAEIASAPGTRTHLDKEGSIQPNTPVKRDSLEYGGAVGAGVTAGAIMGGPVGAVAGGLIGAGVVTAHLLVSHPQAVLEPGTAMVFTLSEPLDMTPAASVAN
jgi:hypothetical protein